MSTLTTPRALRRKILGVGALVAGVALVLSGCADGGEANAGGTGASEEEQSEIQKLAAEADPTKPESDTIVGRLWQGPISAQFILGGEVAQEKYGLTFEYDWMTDANVGRAQMAAGEIDIAPGSPYGAVNLTQSGSEALIVAGNYISQPGDTFTVALPDSGITSVADLEGKTVAFTAVSGVHPNRLRLAIKEAGGDPNNVTIVAVPYSEMAAQLEAGVIDAATVAAFAVADVRALGAVDVFDTGAGDYAGRPENVWITTRDYYTKHPNTIAAFQCATAEGGALANDPEVMEKFMADVLGWKEGLIAVSQKPISVDGPLGNDKFQLDWDDEVELYGSEEFDVSTIVIPFPEKC